MNDAQISTQISQGKGNMPPFAGTLDSAKINSLIPIVRELSKNAAAAKKPS
jgi:mono/diheme cytochrome c family protein